MSSKEFSSDSYTPYMSKNKLKTHTPTTKLISDWCDKKKYLIHYRVLKFYVEHGMIVDKNYEITSFKQSKWLKNYINFITQTIFSAENDFEKEFYKILNIAFYGKSVENVRNKIKLKIFWKTW